LNTEKHIRAAVMFHSSGNDGCPMMSENGSRAPPSGGCLTKRIYIKEEKMIFDTNVCGIRIKALRTKNGITQEILAEQLHISDEHLRKIEAGSRGASIDLFIEIAEYFGVSLDYLLLGRENGQLHMRRELLAIADELIEIAGKM